MACREDAYVFNDTCRSCGPGYAPDETMTSCIKLTAEVIPWTSPWALVPLIFASIGILSTLFTTVVFIRYVYMPAAFWFIIHFININWPIVFQFQSYSSNYGIWTRIVLRTVSRNPIVLRYEFCDIKQANYVELHVFENRSRLVPEHLLQRDTN